MKEDSAFFIKLTTGEEVVASSLLEIDSDVSVGYPLKLIREEFDGGEMISFETLVPFQVDKSVAIAKTGILFKEQASKTLVSMYRINLFKITQELLNIGKMTDDIETERKRHLQ